jgi:predicted RNA-binding protein with PUA-like domain
MTLKIRAKAGASAGAGQEPAPGSRCWLVKQEPESYPWRAFSYEGRTSWDGVRNYQARNNLLAMCVGDRVLFYESGDSKAVVGTARVARAAYPDPTAEEPGWVSVELEAKGALARPVTLARIKADPGLAGIALVRNSRLSVMPLSAEDFGRIVSLGG